MIRVVKIRSQYYAMDLPNDDEEAMKEIAEFVNNGTPVIVIEDLHDLRDFDIDEQDVIIVERQP